MRMFYSTKSGATRAAKSFLKNHPNVFKTFKVKYTKEGFVVLFKP